MVNNVLIFYIFVSLMISILNGYYDAYIVISDYTCFLIRLMILTKIVIILPQTTTRS